MNPRAWTLIFMAAVVIAIAVADTHWATDSIPGNTISEMCLGWCRKHPLSCWLFGFSVGVLVGHLLFPQYLPAGAP